MSKLVWDKTGERYFEAGVDRCVLFVMKNGAYQSGVAWNGISSINGNPSGAEPSPIYADNIKYANLMSNEEYGEQITAYTYPEEFEECDGSASIATGVTIGQQKRSKFGYSYRSKIGNDTDGTDCGYRIHLVYGAQASPSERSHNTINENTDAEELSWDIATDPIEIPGFKPTSHIVIDSTKVAAEELKAFEDILYGTESKESKLPLPTELITIFKTGAVTLG